MVMFLVNFDTAFPWRCKGNYAVCVKIIMSNYHDADLKIICLLTSKISLCSNGYEMYFQKHLTSSLINDIIYLTLVHGAKGVVKTKDKNDPKAKALSEQGALNQRADRVTDPLFRENEFFDPRDLIQVKYEMIRKVTTDGKPVAQAAQSFGFSRPSFYQAQSAFTKEGLSGLIPRKRGPRSRHKVTDEVMEFIEKLRAEDASIGPKDLAQKVQAHFGIRVHQRSIERAMGDKKKR